MQRGFTLIELLVVIAIIGFLAAIIIVGLAQSRESAKIVAAKAEVSQILKAAAIVYAQYGYYPSDSHGSLICPRDIVLDSSGRKWGDFISSCLDPWGHVYRWDNLCPDGTPRKHDNLGTCPTFAYSDTGSIGVTVVGPDDTENGCTGDDFCSGVLNHVTYGWDGNTVPAAPVGPQCMTQTSDCSSLSVALCTSRSGCSLVAGGCAGTFASDNDCSSLSTQSTCQAQTGCSWGNQACSGTRPACTTYGNSSTCNAASGCGWNVTGGTCTGTVSCSTYASNASTCSAAGCTAGGTCALPLSGTYCSQFNGAKTSCQNAGCTCSPASTCATCSASATTCSSQTSQSTCGARGCTWTGNCTGSPSCSGLSQGSCTPTGCSWTNTSSCTGTPTACTTYTNSSTCTTGGCTWGGGACSGTYSTNSNCSTLNSQSTCQAQTGCSWSGQSCTGSAASCSGYSSEATCGAQAGCLWQ